MRLQNSSTDGYTLIELLVVMGILALVATIATPVASHMVRAATARSDTYRLITELRRVQALAVRTQQTISVEPTSTTLHISTGQQPALSEAATVEISAPLVYYPDGTTSGGRLSLHDGGLQTDISVAWLTGAITIEGAP